MSHRNIQANLTDDANGNAVIALGATLLQSLA
jgi:hypothetical protein